MSARKNKTQRIFGKSLSKLLGKWLEGGITSSLRRLLGIGATVGVGAAAVAVSPAAITIGAVGMLMLYMGLTAHEVYKAGEEKEAQDRKWRDVIVRLGTQNITEATILQELRAQSVYADLDHDALAEAIASVMEIAQDTQGDVAGLWAQLEGQTDAIQAVSELLESHQDQFDTAIPELQSSLVSIEQGLKELLRHQPRFAIESDIDPDDPRSLFLYQARKVQVFGRESVQEALCDFLGQHDKTTRPFAWWLLTGPGGTGKSRLALELCLEARKLGWSAGRLDKTQDIKDWAGWKPVKPTLIVVDYAALRIEETKESRRLGVRISDLAARSGEFEFPVRMLLLERDPLGHWYEKLWEVGVERMLMEKTFHRIAEKSLHLEPLDEEAIRSIFDSIAPNLLDDWKTTYARFCKFDPRSRPLFAAFLAETLRDNPGSVEFDQEDVLRSIIKRYSSRIWEPAGIRYEGPDSDVSSKKHIALLVLATMCRGLELKADLFGSLDGIPESVDHFNPDWHHTLSGEHPEDTLAPLQPDMLGELFVLDYFGEPSNKLRLPLLHETAFDRNPLDTVAFISLAAMDFPGHPTLDALIMRIPETHRAKAGWCLLAGWLLSMFDSPEPLKLEKAEKLYGLLNELAGKHPDHNEYQWVMADASLTYTNTLRTFGRLDNAIEVANRTIGIYEHLINSEGCKNLRGDLAWAHSSLGVALEADHQLVGAVDAYDKAIAICEQLINKEGRKELRSNLAGLYGNRGEAMRIQGEPSIAVAYGEKTIKIYEQLVEKEGRSDLRGDLAKAYSNQGLAERAQDQLGAAGKYHTKAIQIRKELVEEGGREDFRNDLAASYSNRGIVLDAQGQTDNAMEDHDRAIEIREELVKQESRTDLQNDLAMAYNNRSGVHGEKEDYESAFSDISRAIELYSRLVFHEHRSELTWNLAMAYCMQGSILGATDRLPEAWGSFISGIELLEPAVKAGKCDLLPHLLDMACQICCIADSTEKTSNAVIWLVKTISHLQVEIDAGRITEKLKARSSNFYTHTFGQLDALIAAGLDGYAYVSPFVQLGLFKYKTPPGYAE
jgi:tetratricopeptide (TPR) repeat protein